MLRTVAGAVLGVFSLILPLVAQSPGAATFPFELRTIDGHGNNLQHPDLGAAGEPLLRLFAAAYADGVGAPAGPNRPNPRAISNMLCSQAGDMPNATGASGFLWQWGQFVDHDLTEVPPVPAERLDIAVPAGDPWFDPFNTGVVSLPFERSLHVMEQGARQQVNELTAFVDASQIYGSESFRAQALRTWDGTGRLKTSPGGYLPYNTEGLPNQPDSGAQYFLAGDTRANEQLALLSLHTLFVREHNFWADGFRNAFPWLPGTVLYELARTVVIAEIQAITYNEWLPLLLGSQMPPYAGYDPQADPRIANTFAAAAFRVGHTMLPSQLMRLHESGQVLPQGNLSLAAAFFVPQELLVTGIEPLLVGLAHQPAQKIDPLVVDPVRNFLFGPPGAGGLDLAALNIQRGREHGIPAYNDLRQEMGFLRAQSFAEVTVDPMIQWRLAGAYASVEDLDPWVGLLSETPVGDSLVGPTLTELLRDQFARIRAGDRFWYESYLPPEVVLFLHSQRLSDIIRRNTTLGSGLPADVFRLPGSAGAGI